MCVQLTMRYCILLILFIATKSRAQNSSYPDQATAQVTADARFILINKTSQVPTQIMGWKAQAKLHPADAHNWLNYYLWTERDASLAAADKKTALTAIVNESKTHIDGKGEYYLMQFLESGKKDSASIYKALELSKDKIEAVQFAVQYFIIINDKPALKRYCKKLNEFQPLTQPLYRYHYDVLMSANTNATIYAKGLNDLLPMAILQEEYGIRKDISLKYYTGDIINTGNSYLCLTIGKDIIAKYPTASSTGLLLKISAQPTINELRDHVEKDFAVTPLINLLDKADAATIQLYKNYLPAFILLYKYYSVDNAGKASNLKKIIEKIASKNGIAHEVNLALGK